MPSSARSRGCKRRGAGNDKFALTGRNYRYHTPPLDSHRPNGGIVSGDPRPATSTCDRSRERGRNTPVRKQPRSLLRFEPPAVLPRQSHACSPFASRARATHSIVHRGSSRGNRRIAHTLIHDGSAATSARMAQRWDRVLPKFRVVRGKKGSTPNKQDSSKVSNSRVSSSD